MEQCIKIASMTTILLVCIAFICMYVHTTLFYTLSCTQYIHVGSYQLFITALFVQVGSGKDIRTAPSNKVLFTYSTCQNISHYSGIVRSEHTQIMHGTSTVSS